jgi:LmbE family N-acetylglucosaminyl deacetylase
MVAIAFMPTRTSAKGKSMPRVFFYAPHPDDETLSMGLAMVWYIANGYDVHLVSMNSGGAIGVANTLNGVTACSTQSDHPYTHNPSREGYAPLSVSDIAAARILEARSALGAMAMIPPNAGVTPGMVTHHIANLPDMFGANGAASSTAPVTPDGIAAAKAAMLPFVTDYPNSFHYTMSPADHHPDHAACGLALREIKAENPTLLGTPRFFVSRLYWAASQPDGLYAADLLAAAGGTPSSPNGTLAWFNYSGTRKAEFDAWLRTKVITPYRTWNPAAGSYGIGYHQVAAQFTANFGTGVGIGNLWHS